MQPIKYNQLQAKVLAHLISDPHKLRILHTLTSGKATDFFTGPYVPFYLAIQWLNDNKKEINMPSVVGTVKKSTLGKVWAKRGTVLLSVIDSLDLTKKQKERAADSLKINCIDVVEQDIKKQLGNDSVFGALVSKMLWHYPQKEINPPPPIKRCVLSRKQIGFLEIARKKIGKAKWNELKKQLGVETAGINLLSRGEAHAIIDYVKSEGLLDEKKV